MEFEFRYQVKDERVREAFRKAPRIMAANLRVGLDKAAAQMLRSARDKLRENDSLAFSTLIQAITVDTVGTYERLVKAGTDYAAYLEKGTRAGYWPSPKPLLAWLEVRRAAEPERAVFRLKKHIYQHGTKAHPFWQPAFEEAEPKMRQIVDKYVMRGVARTFGRGQ